MKMEKQYPVDVICQFTKDGKIMPLKFRVRDGGYREYKIISYKERFKHLEYRQEFMMDYQLVSEIDYTCKVMEDEEEREIYLRYYIQDMKWVVEL